MPLLITDLQILFIAEFQKILYPVQLVRTHRSVSDLPCVDIFLAFYILLNHSDCILLQVYYSINFSLPFSKPRSCLLFSAPIVIFCIFLITAVHFYRNHGGIFTGDMI